MSKAIRTAATVAFLLPGWALAEELAFSTGVDLNYKKVDFELKDSFGVKREFKPNLWMLGISPSLSYGRFFVSLNWEHSLGAGTSQTVSQGTTVDQGGGLIVTVPSTLNDARVERSESSLTAGYNVWAGLTLFAGYLKNSSDITNTATAIDTGPVTATTTFTYTERGPYAGLAYAHRFDNRGVLSASFAYLRGDGKVSTQGVTVFSGTTTFYSESVGEGDVNGTSYALSWSAPLTGSLYYRIGGKFTRYTFTYAANPNFPALKTEAKQNYNGFLLGVANYF